MKRGFLSDSKKAQAAMEFLMTYGWALLVVLVAIGALAFFGVLNPGQFLPSQCAAFAGLSCVSYVAVSNGASTNGELNFQFQNGLGYTLTSFTADVLLTGAASPLAAAGTNDCVSPVLSVVDGGTVSCDYDAGILSQDQRVKGKITFRWTDNAANARVRTGDFVMIAEGP
jgi:hypothetical protein